jgi:hypothetical protein
MVVKRISWVNRQGLLEIFFGLLIVTLLKCEDAEIIVGTAFFNFSIAPGFG